MILLPTLFVTLGALLFFGHDELTTGASSDEPPNDDGDDTGDPDSITGTIGNDVLRLEPGQTGFGGDGNDRIQGFDRFATDLTAHGEAGDDTISLGAGGAGFGGEGDDVLTSRGGGVVYGGSGDDQIDVLRRIPESGDLGTPAQAYGGSGDDLLDLGAGVFGDGGSGDDTFYAYGNEQLGFSTVQGGNGNDSFNLDSRTIADGGQGNDEFFIKPSVRDSDAEGEFTPSVSGGLGEDTFILGHRSGQTPNDFVPVMAVIEDYDPENDALVIHSDDVAGTLSSVEISRAPNETYTDLILNYSPDVEDQYSIAYRILGDAEISIDDILVRFEQQMASHSQPRVASLTELVTGDDASNSEDFTGRDVYFIGYDGNDNVTLSGEVGVAILGQGNDTLLSEGGVNIAFGGDGDDVFHHSGTDQDIGSDVQRQTRFFGDSGNDQFFVSGDHVLIYADEGDDVFTSERSSGDSVEFYGGSGNDVAEISLGQTASRTESVVVNVYPEHLTREPAEIHFDRYMGPGELFSEITLNIPRDVTGDLVLERDLYQPPRAESVETFTISLADGPELLKVVFEGYSNEQFSLDDITINRDFEFSPVT
jgi:Ca2+-binding RTX toxin-like protein